MIVALCQNDLRDVATNRWESATGELVPTDAAVLPARIRKPTEVVSVDGARVSNTALGRLWPPARNLLKRSFLVGFLKQTLSRRATEPQKEPEAAERKLLVALDHLRAATSGAPLTLFLIPDKASREVSPFDRLVLDWAARRGVVALAPTDFSPADYFVHDGHWLPRGHVKAARHLARALVGERAR